MCAAWGEGTSKSAIRRKNRGERLQLERKAAQAANIKARGAVLVNTTLTVRQVEYLVSLLDDDDHDNAIRANLISALPIERRKQGGADR